MVSGCGSANSDSASVTGIRWPMLFLPMKYDLSRFGSVSRLISLDIFKTYETPYQEHREVN